MSEREAGRRIAIAGAFVGVLLLVLDDPLARFIGLLLPGRGQISSSGTDIEPFLDVAPQIIQRTGIVTLAVAAIASVLSLWHPPKSWHVESRGRRALLLVVLATAAWYGWLAEPHNAFYTNARFHWVDYITWDSSRFTYAAGKIPHLVFYESPYLWQAINAGLVVLLVYAMGRRLGMSTWVSTALATVPAIGGNLLLFATTAEDVFLNTGLLLLVIVAALRRQPVLIGLALGLATFGRPSFVILIACFVAGEVVVGVSRRTKLRELDWRYLMTAAGIGIIVVAVGQLVFSILGNRYLFVDGQLIRQDKLEQWVPRPVEGFTVSPFSGVYLSHLIWVAPLVVLVGAAISVFSAKGQSSQVQAALYMSGFFVVGHVLLHESKPLAYYNGRYLAYVFPFLFFMAAALLAHPRFPTLDVVRSSAVALLVLGTAVFPADPIGAKRDVENRPETQLLDARHELREITDGRFVFLDFGDVFSRNYLAYVLRRDIFTIRLVGKSQGDLTRPVAPDRGEDLGPDNIVISIRDDPWSTDTPSLEVGDFVVFEVTDSSG